MNIVFKTISRSLLGVSISLCPAYADEAEQSGQVIDIGTINFKPSVISADGSIIAGSYIMDGGTRAVMWNGADMASTFLASPDNATSFVNSISADGTYIVGYASTGGAKQAMVWHGGAMGTVLGTLGGRTSNALAVSADGNVIVGDAMTFDGVTHAAKWLSGSASAIDLGTLWGKSSATGVSADGRVIVGVSYLESGHVQAVSWSGGAIERNMVPINLGSLAGRGSEARVVSANGRVIAGQSLAATGKTHAVSWTDGATLPTDLGTLGGHTSVVALSADGSVIAGMSINSIGLTRAVSWRNGATAPTDMGSFHDNGSSSVASISADGSIIVGFAQTVEKKNHAVFWAAGAAGPTHLGTLGGLSSNATAISSDGTVIIGTSTLASGEEHATIWKLLVSQPPPVTVPTTPKPSVPSADPSGNPVTLPDTGEGTSMPEQSKPQDGSVTVPKPVGIDVTNTVNAVAGLANDTFSVIESQRRGLNRLQKICEVAKAGESCYSVSTDIGQAGEATDVLGWVSAAHAFTDNFLAGLTLAHSVTRDLPGDFDRNNSNIGGGIHAQWQGNTRNGDWYLRGAIAANRYDVTRTRRMSGYTEPGTGESTITGWGASLELGQSFDLRDQATIGYYGGLRYSYLKMDGYTESNAYFPFHYSDVKSERTTAYIGANYTMALAEKMRWSVNAEIEQDLAYKDPIMTANADYIGELKFEADAAHTRGSVSTTLSYRFSDGFNIGVTPYAARTVNRDTAYGTVIDVSGKF